ncbi:MAG: MiaB/RimO family radical SAM methylthiotransferase [Planctomycetes bacterium]|nr:MiaB/RimO family radical SAM methylthiotransferase [Planctomycetota bacterium]
MVVSNFISLGCKVNQAEMAELKAKLRGAADTCIINTCALTATSEAKSRKLIRRAIKLNPDCRAPLGAVRPDCRLIVTGCYATSKPDEVKEILKGTTGQVVVNEDKMDIGNLTTKTQRTQRPLRLSGECKTRAMLKIQDGCNQFCSYCIIPYLRGKPTSRPPDEIYQHAQKLAADGYKEIVITGINTGSYTWPVTTDKHRCTQINLTCLLKRIITIPGIERVRISSIELNYISDELIDLMRNPQSAIRNPQSKICPHLHIPLQSGSDRILKLMNRRYTASEYLKRLSYIKKKIKHPSITTDVIVGFPVETDADFRQTLAVCKKAGFSKIHVFPYSPRAGTPAASLKPVQSGIVKARARTLQKLADQLALDYKRHYINKAVEVLVEGKKDGFSERYMRVEFQGAEKYTNQLVRVKVTDATPETLIAQVVSGLSGFNR